MSASYEQQGKTRPRRAEAVRLRASRVPYREIAERLGYSSASAASKDVSRAQKEAEREKFQENRERERRALVERARRLEIPEARAAVRAERADQLAWLGDLGKALGALQDRGESDPQLVMLVVLTRLCARQEAVIALEEADCTEIEALRSEREIAALVAEIERDAPDMDVFLRELEADGEQAARDLGEEWAPAASDGPVSARALVSEMERLVNKRVALRRGRPSAGRRSFRP